MKLALAVMMAGEMWGAMIAQPGKSPLVTVRVVFGVGAASDPAGKEGLASLTAAMIAEGGTRKTTYKQIVDAMFPMATRVEWQVDKEMTAFVAETHVDNLEKFYGLFREMLLEPGWREEDLSRIKDQAVNFLRVSLRGNNDEELGKEVLYSRIYSGHPYGHHNMGRAGAIAGITAEDLKQFYGQHYTQARMTIAVAGGYPAGFPARMEKDFAALPKGTGGRIKLPAVKTAQGRRLTLVEKDTRSVAMSIGFPIHLRRGHAEYVALLLAASWLGQHRNSGVRLYDRIREVRGLNYGDYAYIEYFPRGMFLMEPEPNLARQQQIFQVWIRPVVPETAHFTLRLAFWELERLVREGLKREDFERTRNFLSKYVNLLMKTKQAELGYAIDSRFYGTPEYAQYIRSGLAKLTVEDVNRAVRRHLRLKNVRVVMVASGCEELRKRIVEEAPSPITYNSPKPEAVLAEDKVVARHPLGIELKNTRVVALSSLFE